VSRVELSRFARAGTVFALAVLQATASAFAADDWRIDPGRTTIGFAIDAAGFSRTEGRFHRFEGRISVDFDHPGRSSVVFHVQSQSVDVGSPSFSDYLRSPAFLDSARRPSIDFVSTSVERINDHAVRVSGELTLLGVSTSRLGAASQVAALALHSMPKRGSTGSPSG